MEGLALVAVAVVLSARPRRIVAAVAGILFTLLTLVKILNMGVRTVDRAFNPVIDWGSVSPAMGVVRDSIGATLTNIVLVALWLGLILLVGAIIASTIHITAVAARHRRATVRALAALTAVWALCAGLSLQLVPGSPVASTSADRAGRHAGAAYPDSARRPAPFRAALHGSDPEASVPAADLLTGLRGKDVIIAFVESYGQVAVQGTSFSPGIDAVLRQHTACWPAPAGPRRAPGSTPRASAGSANSPTPPCSRGCGSTPHSGMASWSPASRFTLSDAFDKAGWHTVSDSPG